MENLASKNVLITGGTGIIGGHLTSLLINNGYKVAYVSRSSSDGNIKVFQWDLKSGYLEPGAIQWADYIIHLAGAGIADERWTKKRKKTIRDSRVKTAELLTNKLKTETNNVKAFISASGVGYYGDTGDNWTDEMAPPAKDFFGRTSLAWEEGVEKAKESAIRVCIFRTGLVLTKAGGGLPQLAKPIKYFAGAPLGTGKQYISWIHIDDLCFMYLKAIEDENMAGIYNAVAPNPVTNKEFTKTLAEVLQRPLFLPRVPEFVMKVLLGEMADVVLISSKISNQKIIEAGYQFRFDHLKKALMEIYRN